MPAGRGSTPRSGSSGRASWSTAARALLGGGFRISRRHGQFVESALAPHVTAAIHPSAVLRRKTEEERHREMRGLVEDMRQVARALRCGS